MTTTETCRRWNTLAGEWETVTVETTPQPRRRARARNRTRKQGTPRDLTGVAASSPLADWWRDTAYAPSDGFADMRTFIKPDAIRTHRTPTVAF